MGPLLLLLINDSVTRFPHIRAVVSYMSSQAILCSKHITASFASSPSFITQVTAGVLQK